MGKVLSERQILFAEYLLMKLGFNDSKKMEIYLEKIRGKYVYEINYDSGYAFGRCITELKSEIELKENLGAIKLKNVKNNLKISATDLSNFNFCPASYSIHKSFVIESPSSEENADLIKHPTNEEKTKIGTKFHENLRLVNKHSIEETNKDTSQSRKHYVNDEKINKIKNCELIFSGHTDEKKYFENKKENFIGQPDYIFKDPNDKYFVVEEKFKYLNSSKGKNLNKFNSNHIIQLQSYIKYIKEYKIDYGILIYWFYDINGEIPIIRSYSMKVIKEDDYTGLLNHTISNLSKFIEQKEMNFENQVNLTKCISCVVNKYCSHKTGEFKNIKVPYNRYDMKLKKIKFPLELKFKKLKTTTAKITEVYKINTLNYNSATEKYEENYENRVKFTYLIKEKEYINDQKLTISKSKLNLGDEFEVYYSDEDRTKSELNYQKRVLVN